MDEHEKNRENEFEDASSEKDQNNSSADTIGPAVGSLEPVQSTLDPDLKSEADLDNSYQEEAADELTADDFDEEATIDDDSYEDAGFDESDTGVMKSAVGWAAIILAAMSFFIMPIVLGGAGIIIGIFARSRDAKTLGTTAIIAGAVSVLMSFFVRPYM